MSHAGGFGGWRGGGAGEELFNRNTQAYNQDNHLMVKNTEGKNHLHGDPVVAVPAVNGRFETVPDVSVTDGDKRLVGICGIESDTKDVRCVSTGVCEANVVGPVAIGDNLELDKANWALKKGPGTLVALQQVASGTANIPVRIGGGGAAAAGAETV